jgi:hypothetical protein
MDVKICYWDKGVTRIYTKKIDLVDQAKKEGFLVNQVKEKSHIYNSKLLKI